MRVSLLYSADAGDGVSKARLRQEIERHGHEIVHLVGKRDELEQALEGDPELLVAAGGDGTVSQAARAVAGRSIPLAILPLGTANNVAMSLGIEGPIEALIQSWTGARSVAMDLGIIRGSWGESRFIEAAGLGLVAAGIAEMTYERDVPAPAATRVARDAKGYLEVLSRLKPRPCTAMLDGTRVEGAFLLFEVLNICSVGPNLMLAPGADFSDGRLSVVIAEEEHRERLAGYLEARSQGRHEPLDLPTRVAAQIDIEDVDEMHVDDKVRSWHSRETVTIRTCSRILQVLAVAQSCPGAHENTSASD